MGFTLKKKKSFVYLKFRFKPGNLHFYLLNLATLTGWFTQHRVDWEGRGGVQINLMGKAMVSFVPASSME